MNSLLMNVVIMGLYGGAASMQVLGVRKNAFKARPWALLTGFTAVVFHAFALYHWIDLDSGQNLTTFNLFSLVTWFVSLLILLMALVKPIENLLVFIFPLAALSILLVILVPGQHVLQTGSHPRQLIHILLSVCAFSVLSIAGLQAILLAIQERRLRVTHSIGVWKNVPPLETMETILFQMISLGFLLLTILLVSSFYSYHALLTAHFLNKSILAVSAWFVFAVLLSGRKFLGWRGKKAIYCTLSGLFILVCIFSFSYFWAL